jgi:hypothetical protein
MPATCETPLTGFFDQAAKSFGEALQAGVKAQEQVVGFWSEALGKTGAGEYQEKARAAIASTVPVAQKSAEEYLKLVDSNYRKSLEALKKACDGGVGVTPTEFQSRARALFDASVDLVKENAQALVQTNQRVFEAWAEVLRQNGATVAAAVTPKVNPTMK